jgi:transcription initiation factor TFIID subunit 12
MAQPQMIKPDQVDTLPLLPDDRKTFYRNGLAGLWAQIEKTQQGSPERQALEARIRGASTKLMQELASIQKHHRPGSGGGPPQRPPTQGNMMGGGGGAGAPSQQPSMQQQPPQQQQASAGQANPAQPGQPPQISHSVRAQLANIQVHVPGHIPPQQFPAYKQKWFSHAAQELTKREGIMLRGRDLQNRMKAIQAQGQPVPPQMQQQFEQAKRDIQEVDAKWARMKNDNENNGRANGQPSQAQQAQSLQPAPQPNTVEQPPQAPQMQRQGSSNAPQPDVKQESRMSTSPPQPQTGFPQQQSQQPVNQPAPAQTQQPPPQQQAPPQPQPQPQHTPQTATQPQHPPQNFPQQPAQHQQHPQYQQQQRSQINPHASQGQMPQHQPQQTPVSAVQQNPGQQQQPQQQQRPQALSQQAAMAQAAAQYAQGNQQQQQPPPNQPYPPQPQLPSGMPFNQPHSATQPTPTSGFPQQQPLQSTHTNHTKFPIKPQLSLDPRGQQPVQGPPQRPTFSQPGMLQQPGLARPPPFTLEGEGDRVLSKRKLDELVRQVTGGAEDGLLNAEVESLVLQYADDFVDDLITSACKLAKCKANTQLDLKDFQIVLERNYGIRIPGYGLDEARTVKKFVPAAGWQSKMQAIQTSKTLGGVGKADG